MRDVAILGLAGPLLAACGSAAAPASQGAESQSHAEASNVEPSTEGHPAAEGPHWTYEGSQGPDHWAELDPSFATCATGKSQSPIDIATEPQGPGPESIVFDYKPSPLSIVNNGHTIQVDYEPGSTLTLDSTPYQLLQFHFHVPSEHTLKGNQFPMEIHLVHRSAEGQLAVVGGLFYGGVMNKPMVMASVAKNAHLDLVWQDFPPNGVRIQSRDSVKADDLLPVDRRYVTYEGSLTTPPCSEGVRWILLTSPMVVASSHIEKFTSVIGRNARPVQALNGRQIGGG